MPRTTTEIHAQLDRRHAEIAQRLYEEADYLIDQLIAGRVVGFRLDDADGFPTGAACGHHHGPFGLKIRYCGGLGASATYLDPRRPDPVARTQIQLDLERKIAGLMLDQQERRPGANAYPSLAAYADGDRIFAPALTAPFEGLPA